MFGEGPKSGQDPLVTSAIAASNLHGLSPETIAKLSSDSSRIRVPRDSILHREGDNAAHVELVVSGVLRVYVTAVDGRTLTVRYCRPGSILGVASLFTQVFSMPATVKSVTDADVLAMRPGVVQAIAEQDGRVAFALLGELSERVLSFAGEIPGSAFATVRERVARHLLDLEATVATEGVIDMTQQELAEAVGSVREVVVRTLRELRSEGIVATDRQGITILDPEGLSMIAYPKDRGT